MPHRKPVKIITMKPMKNKQTAVEWLEQEFVKLEATVVDDQIYELLVRAMEMEKQNLIYAVNKENRRCTQIANDTLKILYPDKDELFEADEKIGEITYKQIFEL